MEFIKNYKLFTILVMWPINISYSQPLYNSKVFELGQQWIEDVLLHEIDLFMFGNMNKSVDPCEDFYEYACGNWHNNKRVPQYYRKNIIFDIITDKLEKRLESELMEENLPNSIESGLAKAKKFFRSCSNPGKTELLSSAIKTLFCNEKRNFKKLNLKNNAEDWLTIAFMSRFNVFPLLPLQIIPSTESGKYEISLQPQYNLTEFFIKNSKTFPQVEGKCAKQFQKILEFEANLFTKYTISSVAERVTLSEFANIHQNDAINWREVFQKVFPRKKQDDWYINNYINDFGNLIEFLSKSRIGDLRNYVKWCTVVKFYDIWKDLLLKDDLSRNSKCRQLTESYFTYALLPWFKANFFDEAKHKDIIEIATALKTDFYNTIENHLSWLSADHYSWLSDETKTNIKKKLENMEIIIGYREEMLHRDVFLNKLKITSKLFKNLIKLEAINASKLRRLVNKKLTYLTLKQFFYATGYYNPGLNAVLINIGLAQMPFYHEKFPAALKFGGIGTYIGHEIAHGFDSNKSFLAYNHTNKNYTRNALFSATSWRNFEERVKCLSNEYKQFTYKGLKSNELSMPENIADNAGLHMAYYSYLDWEGSQEESKELLPYLNFTNNQLFFITFAQRFCFARVYSDEAVRYRNEIHISHAPLEIRILVSLRNMKEFAENFQCRPGSQMNPTKKCIVW